MSEEKAAKIITKLLQYLSDTNVTNAEYTDSAEQKNHYYNKVLYYSGIKSFFEETTKGAELLCQTVK
ncbi:MAG TPA: hypothetical protein DF296_00050 [Candidatus Margulisbacteria bacterium]|nr:MAG: hypothetical protein A2X43_11640 [Candidatus Margulisbacteria bacterium GWD2_39_127]HAR63778.1 hypothetical protein [Candidatus Margulisiibacteriota bacterium]HCT83573.1 hypothetical protein [Candidatus Margulisiibacteriota bacterium]